MTIFLLVLSLLLVIFSGFLCWQVFNQKAFIDYLIKTNELNTGNITSPRHDPELVITLRVLNPIVLAKKKSRSARILADRLPVMITKKVYQEVMKELKAELAAREIDTDMQIEYR